jgi:hypothetical protein
MRVIFLMFLVTLLCCKGKVEAPAGVIIFYTTNSIDSYSVSFNNGNLNKVKYKDSRPYCFDDDSYYYTQSPAGIKYPIQIIKNNSVIFHDTVLVEQAICKAYNVNQ